MSVSAVIHQRSSNTQQGCDDDVCSRLGSPRGTERCSSEDPWYEERSRRRRKWPDFPAGSRLPGSRDAWFRQPPPVSSPVLWCAVARRDNKPTNGITEHPCCQSLQTRILRTRSGIPTGMEAPGRCLDRVARHRRPRWTTCSGPTTAHCRRFSASPYYEHATINPTNVQCSQGVVWCGVVCAVLCCAVRARAGRRTRRTAWGVSTWCRFGMNALVPTRSLQQLVDPT